MVHTIHFAITPPALLHLASYKPSIGHQPVIRHAGVFPPTPTTHTVEAQSATAVKLGA